MPAGYGPRVAGFLIDVGIPGGLFAAALSAALLSGRWLVTLVVHGLATVIAVIFTVWNCGVCQGRKGQSIGKWALGTRLVDAVTGEPVGTRRALLRHVAHLLDALPLGLGFLWPVWDGKHRTFADIACSTLVVQAEV
jgi:uncharacterized RDD family membrane protein YckC